MCLDIWLYLIQYISVYNMFHNYMKVIKTCVFIQYHQIFRQKLSKEISSLTDPISFI